MDKQIVQFATKEKNGVVEHIGKSEMLQPKIKYDGRKTKWFDDSKLLKSNTEK